MKKPANSSLGVGLSGLVAGGVFASGLPWFLLPVAIAFFFRSVINTKKPITLKYSFWLTCLFFWPFYAVVLSWFLDTDVSLLAGLDASKAPFILGFCLFSMATVLTIASLPFGAVLYKFQTKLKQPNLLAFVTIISTWIFIEWLRSLAFSIFLGAPEASIGDYWNFGSLGLGIISTPLGYLSRLVGMYGLSALVVALGLTIYWVSMKYYKPLILIVVVAVVGSIFGYKLSPVSGAHQIEGRLLQRESQLGGFKKSTPIRNKSDYQKDLIILPEYSGVYRSENAEFTEKYVTSQLNTEGVILDVNADFINPEPRYSYLIARDKNQEEDSQTKRLLIPTGEYLPSILKGFYKFTGQTEIIDRYSRTRKLEKGEQPHIVSTKNLKVAPVACSGILGRNIYRQLVNEGGEVLTNSASLETFAGSKSYFNQSLQMAKFHAIANNRTYIQATIGAPGFVIDNDGHFIIEPDGAATEFADFRFTPNRNKTFYSKYGDWPLMVSALFVAGFSSYLLIKRFRKSIK